MNQHERLRRVRTDRGELLRGAGPVATIADRPDAADIAERLAACWNACAGLDMQELSHGAVTPLWERSRLVEQIERLRAEVDRLKRSA